MIRLAGFEPGEEIEIAVTGVRPGERLNEILFAQEEPRVLLYGIDGVMAAKPVFADRAVLEGWILRLREAVTRGNRAAVEVVFEEAVPDFRERGGVDRASEPHTIGGSRSASATYGVNVPTKKYLSQNR